MAYRSQSASTRQLTDDEQALQEPISSFIQNQSPVQTFDSEQGKYAWMERDLKMRNMQAQNLQNETQLAGEMGDRVASAAEKTKQTDDEINAQRGLDLMAKKVASGTPPTQAHLETNQELGLDMNDQFNQRALERAHLYQTPDSLKRQQMKDHINDLKLDQDSFDEEAKWQAIQGDDAKQQAIKTYADDNVAKGYGAAHSRVMGRAQDLADRITLEDVDKREARWKQLGNGTQNDLDKLNGEFNDMGLGGVVDTSKLVRKFSDPENNGVLRMLANKEFLRKELPDDPVGSPNAKTSKEKFADFARTINDLNADPPKPEAGQIAQDEWSARRNRAAALVSQLSGKHANEQQDILDRRDKAKIAFETNKETNRTMELARKTEAMANKDVSNIFKDASQSAFNALKLKKDAKTEADPSVKTNAIVSAARSFFARARALMPPGNDKLFAPYEEKLDWMVDPVKNGWEDTKVGGTAKGLLKDPGAANSQVHALMADFIAKRQGLPAPGGASAPQVQSDTTGSSAPAAQVAPAATQVTSPDKNAEALDWLNKNPNHPSAPAVRAKLGIKP